MFASSFTKLSLFALALSMPMQAFGHALIEPALGVTGQGARSDVQRPSKKTPCGSLNIADALADTTPVKANGDAFTVSVQNFNAGKDGSTQIASTLIDTSGTGKSFTGGSVSITKNGVLAPSSTGTVQVSGTLPSGTKCTGGKDGASCLVSFTTAGGFGNCILISQGGNAATNKATGTDATTTSAAANPKTTKTCGKQAGTRAARSVKAREAAGEIDLNRRESWAWAA